MTVQPKTALRAFVLLMLTLAPKLHAEDGSRLWLRYDELSQGTSIPFSTVVSGNESLALQEIQTAYSAWTGDKLTESATIKANSLLIATLENGWVRRLGWSKELKSMHREGYVIRHTSYKGNSVLVVASPSSVGAYYGTFHLLRCIQTETWQQDATVAEQPSFDLRMLNHWDNLDRTIERGYAGHSIWQWDELPETLSPRYEQYARANASIGINATVLNNVNATPAILTSDYLNKVQALANVFRPHGLKVFLSINFSSPKELGGLENSDPLNPKVRKWWKTKAKEIYSLIPDFGGFLVKANSEGLPGPQDYQRTHADGANMLAEAMAPYGGLILWRAFVYNPDGNDRARQAYDEFMPLDGAFHPNVIVQVKNGPVDFQPREPFSPLFGAMKETPLMVEFQITQEYLGFSNHLVYEAPLFKECLDADTYQQGSGSTVARATDGSLYGAPISAIAGVANIGEETNWCGHHFAQANWYAYGRLAWNHSLSAESIAEEWIKQTFTTDTSFINPVRDMMIDSREAVVNYMMPMGLHHLFAEGHHYGPEPWMEREGFRPDWLPSYYHKATTEGVGFNRTASGSNALEQYTTPWQTKWNNPKTCDPRFILWFHHIPWTFQLADGSTLWDALCLSYQQGVEQVRHYQCVWDEMQPYVDASRFRHVQSRLRTQCRDAIWWRDACLLYFQEFARMPFPKGMERPIHDLEDLKKIRLNMKHHN